MREVVNDFTPERTPHETFLTEPRSQRMDFVLVDDDDADSIEAQKPSMPQPQNHEPRRVGDFAMQTVEVKLVADYSSNNGKSPL